VGLPDTTGWTVLDQFKHDALLRHIPVHVISIHEERRRALALGAYSCFRKDAGSDVFEGIFERIQQSLSRQDRTVLLVSANEAERRTLADLIEADHVTILMAATAAEAVAMYAEHSPDCVVVTPGSPDLGTDALLSAMQERAGDRELQAVVYTGAGGTDTVVIPHGLRENVTVHLAGTPERLLSETTKILHLPENSLPEYKRLKLAKLREMDPDLAGSRVLIVDDDIRNIFALTSVLQRHDIQVMHAENGRAGIDTLMHTPGIDIVLMDIMMPGMYGYETTRAIRAIEAFKNLPIIALTAKAMKGDREKCLEAGASDYLAKPVNTEQLLSALRMWLHR
jgi:CheY-like chemotaxis protein